MDIITPRSPASAGTHPAHHDDDASGGRSQSLRLQEPPVIE